MPTLAETLVGFALRSYATGLPETIFRQGQRAFPEIDCKFLDQVCLRMPKPRRSHCWSRRGAYTELPTPAASRGTARRCDRARDARSPR
jgi:hypothetical protein